jgi:hypothetical protein
MISKHFNLFSCWMKTSTLKVTIQEMNFPLFCLSSYYFNCFYLSTNNIFQYRQIITSKCCYFTIRESTCKSKMNIYILEIFDIYSKSSNLPARPAICRACDVVTASFSFSPCSFNCGLIRL